METSSSSSSDDSCDSFGSDGGFAITVSVQRALAFCQTVVSSTASLNTDVSAVEEHVETEQEDDRETKDDQGHAGRRRVQRFWWERDQPSDGVDGQFAVSIQNHITSTVVIWCHFYWLVWSTGFIRIFAFVLFFVIKNGRDVTPVCCVCWCVNAKCFHDTFAIYLYIDWSEKPPHGSIINI